MASFQKEGMKKIEYIEGGRRMKKVTRDRKQNRREWDI
jgi:hypothetical protein